MESERLEIIEPIPRPSYEELGGGVEERKGGKHTSAVIHRARRISRGKRKPPGTPCEEKCQMGQWRWGRYRNKKIRK